MASIKDNLIAAKALIADPTKWIKGQFGNDDGCLCAAGALKEGAHMGAGEVWHSPEIDALRSQVPGNRPVPEFNDHPDTTHADIMALFDRAIAAQDGAA